MYEYANAPATCAVTGGYVVRDPGLTELAGRYVFADFCEGQLRSLTLASPDATDHGMLGLGAALISSFGEDACRRVYVVSLSGTVSRLVDETPTACSTTGPDIDPPVLSLEAPGSQPRRLRRVRLTARTSEDCSATVSAVIRSRGGRRLRVEDAIALELIDGATEQISAHLTRSEAKRVRGWVDESARSTRVVFSGRCRDAAANWSDKAVEKGRLRPTSG